MTAVESVMVFYRLVTIEPEGGLGGGIDRLGSIIQYLRKNLIDSKVVQSTSLPLGSVL